ncbi:HNH endonuclease [Streptomyces californicus]|uniref:HNH endonuclease n=2 Tax=Streptomyces californicus TaxID=67351 RepID=UPI00099D0674
MGYPVPVAKRCTRCKAMKPAADFHKFSAADDGLRPRCRACRRPQSARYYRENRDEISRRGAERYARNPEVVKVRVKRYQAAHPEGLRRRQARYAATEGGKAVQKAAQQRRRARKAAATVEHFNVADVYEDWADLDLWVCFYCAGPAKPLQMDHFEPLARGGAHGLINLVPACADCNHAKSDKEPWSVLSDHLGQRGVDLSTCVAWLNRAAVGPEGFNVACEPVE